MTDGPTNLVGVYHSPLVENVSGHEANEGDQWCRPSCRRCTGEREREEELERAMPTKTGKNLSRKSFSHEVLQSKR